jgi:hypothetical protein
MLRPTILAFLVALAVTAGAAGQGPAGRWEGQSQIPGRSLPLVVDLAQEGASAWVGSIIIPGLGIKGAPLSNVVVTDSSVAFDVANALGAPPYGPATFKATLAGDKMTGEMRQAGNVAKFSLAKVGLPQVESPPRSTPVARALEAQWTGEFELGGYPRHVTMTLENHAAAGATAKLLIVGKQTTDLPVDFVLQDGNLLRIESSPNQIAFEGRVDDESREIKGTFELGALELPLTLRRRVGGAT